MGTCVQRKDFISRLPHLMMLECLQTTSPCPGSVTFQSRDGWETISRNLHYIKILDLSSGIGSFINLPHWYIRNIALL